MAAATNPARTALISEEHRPPNESQPCHVKAPPSQPCFSGLKAEPKNAQSFLISAFLACPDSSGRYPSKSKFPEAKCVRKDLHCPELLIPSTSSSHAQSAATTAAYCALASRSLQTVPIPFTYDPHIQQEQPAPPSPPIKTSNTSCPVLLDSLTKKSMPPTVSTTPSTHLAHAAPSAKDETANGESQDLPLAYDFERERPYLDDARTIVNPRFHGRWQRHPVVVASDTSLAYNKISPQTRKRSRFFADGKLIGYGGISATEAPGLTENDVTTYTAASTPISPGISSPSPPIELHDRLDAQHASNTFSAPDVWSKSSATADVPSLDTGTSPNTHDDDDTPQRISPLLESHSVDLDPPIQDYCRPTLNAVCHLELDVEESTRDSDAAEYNMVSPVLSQDFWVELPTPPQSSFDVESISDDESDKNDDDEFYYESYWAETLAAPTNDTRWTHDGANTSAVEWPTVQETMKSRHTGVACSPSSTKDDDDFNWDSVTDRFM
ncbi:hypothetical protein G6011_10628 [Alternaria panax]|uniref:Uncharacterized protein n=1 Tax=Alternaria panax TaxID=48097 RepID=A0AAD4IC84_9PLEO|nr:hypothetical protein G6011_10628 [Alternaria panax]